MKSKYFFIVSSVICLMFLSKQVFAQSCLQSGIIFTSQTEVDNFPTLYPGCTIIEGDVVINGNNIVDLTALTQLIKVGANLSISGTQLTNLYGLDHLEEVSQSLNISNNLLLTSIQDLSNLAYVGASFHIHGNDLTDLDGLQNVTSLSSDLYIDEVGLLTLNGLNNLESAGSIIIENGQQVNLDPLSNLITIHDDLIFHSCTGLESLSGLESLEYVGDLLNIGFCTSLTSIEALDHLLVVENEIAIHGNTILSACVVQSLCDFLATTNQVYLTGNGTNCDEITISNQCQSDATTQVLADRGKGVAINTDGGDPDSSAILDLQSETQTFVFPRMSSVQRNAIINPPMGSMIYDVYVGEMMYYDGNNWEIINRPDNLGNHTATQHLLLGSNNISVTGGNINMTGDGNGLYVLGPNALVGINTIPDANINLDVLGQTKLYSLTSSPLIIRTGTDGAATLIKETDDEYNAITLNSYSSRGRIGILEEGNPKIMLDASSSVESYINAGNFGIGTTTPNSLLHIAGDMTLEGLLYDVMGSHGTPGSILSSSINGVEWITAPAADNLGNHLALQDLDMDGNNIVLNSGWLSGDGDAEGIYIKNSGPVGIHNPNPIFDLDVAGGVNIVAQSENPLTLRSTSGGQGLIIRESDNDTEALALLGFNSRGRVIIKNNGNNKINLDADPSLVSYIDAGNFGIGTDAPDELLHVGGHMRLDGYLEDSGGNPGTSGQLLSSTGSGTSWVAAPAGDNLGNHYATTMLDIGGHNLKINGGWITGDGDDEGIYIDANGYVGIGTDVQTQPLEVQSSVIGGAGYFVNNITTSDQYGVYGKCNSTDNWGLGGLFRGGYVGVQGQVSPDALGTGNYYGVYGTALDGGGTHYGVYGQATGTGTNYAIYGQAINSASNYAGYFNGNVHVTGTLSKGGGSFKIDHPVEPETKYLSHSFVESPDMMNMYNGNILTGKDAIAVVELPDWFEALNKDFRYQLTVIGEFAQAIILEKIENNRFSIKTDKPGVEVSWQVTGIRKDKYAEANRIPVEEDKSEDDKGKYLYPELYGASKEKAIGYNRNHKKQ